MVKVYNCQCSQLEETKNGGTPATLSEKSSVITEAAENLANKSEMKKEIKQMIKEDFIGGLTPALIMNGYRIVARYLMEGLAIALVTSTLPKKKLNLKEVATISIIGALTFFVLDLWAPAIGKSSRLGAGFGIGAKLSKF